uniref:Uncharacterized protein n=1 Tax=Anopheles dirus TaxID=7168 RepID=A0A182NYU7_9DIPT
MHQARVKSATETYEQRLSGDVSRFRIRRL